MLAEEPEGVGQQRGPCNHQPESECSRALHQGVSRLSHRRARQAWEERVGWHTVKRGTPGGAGKGGRSRGSWGMGAARGQHAPMAHVHIFQYLPTHPFIWLNSLPACLCAVSCRLARQFAHPCRSCGVDCWADPKVRTAFAIFESAATPEHFLVYRVTYVSSCAVGIPHRKQAVDQEGWRG